ncbi:site-specific integrase, partial [Limosilactobacillus fermentum]
RHSHVAFLLANGIDLYAISKRLGHSDITTTSRVYSYMIDEYKNLTNNQIIKALGKLSSV